jgi:hypothetical protein
VSSSLTGNLPKNKPTCKSLLHPSGAILYLCTLF